MSLSHERLFVCVTIHLKSGLQGFRFLGHGRSQEMTHLTTFIGFTDIINVPFGMIMVLARDNGTHAPVFAFKGRHDGGVPAATFYL